MKVKILTNFAHNGQQFYEADQLTVGDSLGDYFCRAGWAEDLAGIVPTGTPSASDVVLEVQDITVTTQTTLGE